MSVPLKFTKWAEAPIPAVWRRWNFQFPCQIQKPKSSHHLALVCNSKTLTQFPLQQYCLHSLTLGREKTSPSLVLTVQTLYPPPFQTSSSILSPNTVLCACTISEHNTATEVNRHILQLFIVRNSQTFKLLDKQVYLLWRNSSVAKVMQLIFQSF